MPGEWPAEVVEGDFASLALKDGAVVLSSAPACWFEGDILYEGWPDRLEPTGGPGAQIWASCGVGWLAATEDSVLSELGESWPLAVGALACDGQRRVAVICEPDCRVLDLDSMETLASTGRGGEVALVGGQAWWSDPMLDDEEGGGIVRNEQGLRIEGLPGEHLRRFSGEWVSGDFTDRAVPNRGRALRLDGSLVVSVERGRPGRPLVLATEPGGLAIGVPERSKVLNLDLP